MAMPLAQLSGPTFSGVPTVPSGSTTISGEVVGSSPLKMSKPSWVM
ncbi:Uncharacterised protein [Mycobacteroides abscessus subsp. abscessus]|nr:Uncharacterised protein [Mycobacteroides abscessus subsp. abscessus]